MHTLDSMIELLQQQKADGVAGDTQVAVLAQDNNGKSGFAQRVSGVRTVSLAKAEFDKGWSLCKIVSNRGVTVLVIG